MAQNASTNGINSFGLIGCGEERRREEEKREMEKHGQCLSIQSLVHLYISVLPTAFSLPFLSITPANTTPAIAITAVTSWRHYCIKYPLRRAFTVQTDLIEMECVLLTLPTSHHMPPPITVHICSPHFPITPHISPVLWTCRWWQQIGTAVDTDLLIMLITASGHCMLTAGSIRTISWRPSANERRTWRLSDDEYR